MPEPKPLIRDIPSIKKIVNDVRALSQFGSAALFLRPVLRLLGVNTEEIDNALLNLSDLRRQAGDLARIPDQFNDLFADRGWIIYDRMSLEIAKEAIAIAESGDFERAEAYLVAYYDAETVRWGVMSMNAVQAFRPRMRLLEKALEDYEAGRYHACVPVVIALLDGMVNDLHEKAHHTRLGISADGVDLNAWDSFAAHDKGLAQIVKIFQKGRRKTNTDTISLPYRHGIMHGIDLGYDNRLVAAKTWATLFATREWALKVEQIKVTPPLAEPEKTWKELWLALQETVQTRKEGEAQLGRVREWKPRQMELGKDIARTGSPDEFAVNSPERVVADYLKCWQQGNYGFMARCVSKTLGPAPNKAPAEMRVVFGSKKLYSFEFVHITDEAPAITEIEAKLNYVESGAECLKSHTFRVIYVDEVGMPMMRGEAGAQWAIVTWAVW